MENRLKPTVQEFIRSHILDNPVDLLLKKTSLDGEDLKLAVHQIFCRKKYKQKLPEWTSREDILFPISLSMEQCSSEYTAKKKAEIIGSGNTFVDITGGFGIDTYYIGQHFTDSFHIERNRELSSIVDYNFKKLKTQIKCIYGNGLDFLENSNTIFDAVLIDPARRHDLKGKVYLLEDCEPNILAIQDKILNKARKVYIKLSPMLDIHSIIQKLTNLSDIYVIAYRNEVKELFCCLEQETKHAKPTIHAINIQREGNYSEDFSTSEQKPIKITKELFEYIYEPNKAVLKAGIQDSLASQYELQKLHPFSHLYTSSKLHLSFPGRVLSLKHVEKVQAKAIKSYFPDKRANVFVRNFPYSADVLIKKLKLQDGGSQYVIGTTLWNEEKRLLICERVK